jgi:hypothetical protein
LGGKSNGRNFDSNISHFVVGEHIFFGATFHKNDFRRRNGEIQDKIGNVVGHNDNFGRDISLDRNVCHRRRGRFKRRRGTAIGRTYQRKLSGIIKKNGERLLKVNRLNFFTDI